MSKLYFRHGAVCSAKTLNLLAVVHNYKTQGKAVCLAKPEMDVRFGTNVVKSRAGLEKEAQLLINDETVINTGDFKEYSCVVVDEAQFLNPKHIDSFRKIANSGVPVICYGLRTDFRSHLFAASRRLFELADTIEEIKTTCAYCNKKAVFNLKLVDGKPTLGGPQVELGCEEKYLPVCARDYEAKTASCLAILNKAKATLKKVEPTTPTTRGSPELTGSPNGASTRECGLLKEAETSVQVKVAWGSEKGVKEIATCIDFGN